MSKYEYLPADDSFLMNDDPSLTPIRISLPKPPPLELIDGYGLPPEEQRFEREVVPQRLVNLYEHVKSVLQNKESKVSNYKMTFFRLQKNFWEKLKKDEKHYKKEIEWLKKVWWHRINGYWFFNYGKPTYICGWHYMYLNFWYFPESKKKSGHFPEYRDRDRRWFLFQWYIYKTTETFADYDEKGRPIKVDGKYRMIDIGRKTFYGTINTKQRRAGETHKSLCIGNEIVSLSEGSIGGIISYNKKNSEDHFRKKLSIAWQHFPIYFMPYYDGSFSPQTTINYRTPGTETGETGLNSVIDYAESGEGTAYDGQRLVFILCDEEGKTEGIDILNRWYQLAECMSTGNGMDIIGHAIHPTTVEEMSNGENVERFKMLVEQSDFYERDKLTGRTISGLCRFFIPTDDGAEGFIDSYGYSVKDELKDYQKKEGFRYTATEFYRNERKALLAKGTPDALEKYRSLCRKYPLEYADSWISTSSGIGWDITKIEKRLAELDLYPAKKPRRGNFVGTIETGFRFVDDPEGRWYVSYLPLALEANQYKTINGIDSLTGKSKQMYAPLKRDRFTLGVDPIKEIGRGKSRNKLSNFGGAIFMHHDSRIDYSGIPDEKRITNRFVATYCYRPDVTEEAYKDMIAAAIYYGAMIYPEVNVSGFWEYIEEKGLGGYLKYDYDIVHNKIKDKPGVYTSPQTKQDMYNAFRDYIAVNVEREVHDDLLRQARDIRNLDQLTDFDLLMASMIAYRGATSKINDILIEEVEMDISKLRGIF